MLLEPASVRFDRLSQCLGKENAAIMREVDDALPGSVGARIRCCCGKQTASDNP